MNLLLTLALATAMPAAPVPDGPKGQPIDIAKSFELGVLAESFGLVSVEYTFDRGANSGVLVLKLEAKKDVEQALLRTNAAGFFDDENTLQSIAAVRPKGSFPLEKGERMIFTIQTGSEDRKWKRIVIRKVDSLPSSGWGDGGMSTRPAGGFGGGGAGGGGAGGGRGRDVPPPPPNPFDPNDR